MLAVFSLAVPALAQEPLPATDITAAQMAAFLKGALPRNEICAGSCRRCRRLPRRVFGVFRPKTDPAMRSRTRQNLRGISFSKAEAPRDGREDRQPGRFLPTAAPDRGEDRGGVTRHVSKGDLIIIPVARLTGGAAWTAPQLHDHRPDPEGRIKLNAAARPSRRSTISESSLCSAHRQSFRSASMRAPAWAR
jgi:hypothetical protein